jgi:gluconate 5-dehydrogenase
MSVFQKFRLDGKRALITGGSRGLGKAMAAALAEAGADLVLVGREKPSLESARTELAAFNHRVDLIEADVGQPAEAQRMCEIALRDHGPIHILINNVGGRRINIPTEQLPLEDWQRILDLNLTSAFLCCKLIGGEMVKRRAGKVINIASISGMIANKGIHGRSYETSKAALIAFTKALAVDWAPFNVNVNAIAPRRLPDRPEPPLVPRDAGIEEHVRKHGADGPAGRTGRDQPPRPLPGERCLQLHDRRRRGDRWGLHALVKTDSSFRARCGTGTN